jgi:hypothetical protein
LIARLDAGGRIDFELTWPQVLQDVMSKCWQTKPAARPHFRDVAVDLSFDSNPVVYAALAQSAGGGADYSTCEDSALEATEYSACDSALIGSDNAEVPQYAGSNSAVEYAESNPTSLKAAVNALQAELDALRPRAPTLGNEILPVQNQLQPFVAAVGSKGIQRGAETRKHSVYAGFGEDVNSGGGGIQRQSGSRQGSVYAGFEQAAEEEV